jgi:hypothetical protein
MKRSLLIGVICSILLKCIFSVRLFNNTLQDKDRKNNENISMRKVNSLSESSLSTTSKFQDVINEIKTIKIDLFGNPEENMDFYKRNKNAYDPKLIERLTKIAKILELEELLDFYNSNKKRSSSFSSSEHLLNISEKKENSIKSEKELKIENQEIKLKSSKEMEESDRKQIIIQNQKKYITGKII